MHKFFALFSRIIITFLLFTISNASISNVIFDVDGVLYDFPKTTGVARKIPPEMEQLLQDLQKQQHKLFILSNMFPNTYSCLATKTNLFSYFDGIVCGRIDGSPLKPAQASYTNLLQKYSLQAHSCIFIDDLLRNVIVAREVGITSIHFQSAKQCRHELVAYGILPSSTTKSIVLKTA